MSPGIVIGLDLGTTACKAIALSAAGRIVAVGSATYGMRSSQAGWAEQEADDIWRGAVEALRQLGEQVNAADLTALALSGAMHSVLPVAADGTPLAPAMTWADRRAAPQARTLRARTDPLALYARTGCPLQPIYHPAKLLWWREHAPPGTHRFIALKDFVLFRLTGVCVTDIGLASTAGLLDIRQFQWDDEALSLAGIAAAQLPRLVSPLATVGTITAEASRVTGLPVNLAVVAGTSDGGTTVLGVGGGTVVSVGTSGAIRKLVERPLIDARGRTWCYVLTPGRWFAGGAINNGGLALQWIRERFFAEADFERMLAEASTVPPGAEGVMLLPYFSGERSPHWNPDARAVLFGLGLAHTRAHVARAVLEGVAYCLADVWEALEAGQEMRVSLTGGITRAPLWTQIVADVLNVPLTPVEVADASALGAALLGHAALGQEVSPSLELGPPVVPDPARHMLYRERHQAFQALYRRNFVEA